MAEPDLTRVRAALDAGDYARARELIDDLTLPPSSELLELQAMAAYGDGDLEGTLAADAPDNPIRAGIAAARTYERLMCGDMPGTGHWARKAMEGGHRHGLKAPAIIGQVAHARVRIHDGAVDEGLSALDDVAVELSAGNLDPLTSGQMWCEVICAMQWIGQHDRAEPALGEHLERTVRTGTYFAYEPAPRAPVKWQT